VNLFQRLIGVWWSLWAAARGLDMTRAAPLPAPVVPPTVSAAALIAQAGARGSADGRAAMVDPWSFGGAGDGESEDYDLDYVRGLRHQGEAALLSLRTAQRLTDDQVSVARRRRDEARERMAVAQDRMTGLATDEEDARLRGMLDSDEDLTAPVGTPDDVPDPVEPDARTPWEGESSPLPVFWRLLILIGLAVVQTEVEFCRFSGASAPIPPWRTPRAGWPPRRPGSWCSAPSWPGPCCARARPPAPTAGSGTPSWPWSCPGWPRSSRSA